MLKKIELFFTRKKKMWYHIRSFHIRCRHYYSVWWSCDRQHKGIRAADCGWQHQIEGVQPNYPRLKKIKLP